MEDLAELSSEERSVKLLSLSMTSVVCVRFQAILADLMV